MTRAELNVELVRYRQLARQDVLAVVQTTADTGFPANTGTSTGSTTSQEPATQPERGAIHPDQTAQQAAQLLRLIDRINRTVDITTAVFVTQLRYASDQLETYDPTRNTTIQCVHCKQRRNRLIDECPDCGIPTDAWQCRNPNHAGYVLGPARNGMCEPCDRYHRRRGTHRPADLCQQTAQAQRTSDTQTVDCVNPNCQAPTPWRNLRDGRCPPCAGHFNSLGRDRIPATALNLDHTVINQGDDAA